MLRHDIRGSEETGNCLEQDDTNILTITKKLALASSKKECTIDDLAAIEKYNFDCNYDTEHDYAAFFPHLNLLSENVMAYISDFIVNKIKKCKKCNECLLALETINTDIYDDSSYMLINRKDRGGLVKPRDIIDILKHIERNIRIFSNKTGDKLPSVLHKYYSG